jgi:hypothetical protein
MGLAMSVPQLLIILVIVALIFGTRRLQGFNDDSFRPRSRKPLKSRMPVYSAETTDGKEAEFIRDRLPKRFPTAVILVVIVVFGATVWWLTR